MIPTTNNSSLSMIQEVLNYIEENLTENISPSLIASHFYASVSTVSSLFKIACGMTIMEYIRNRRLTLAAKELFASNISIINLAYKYSYETPEAFTKAFTRFHGFPPSFVRRGFPITKAFLPLQIAVTVQGGWNTEELTKPDCSKQELPGPFCYDDFTNNKVVIHKGGKNMTNKEVKYQIDTSTMQYQKEWKLLYSLAEALLQSRIPFKVDGKTMIFAHGLEIPLDKICLTFKWKDEEVVREFFQHDTTTKEQEGFKFFDARYQGMKIRCMFYGECPGADTDEFLYKNTDTVQVDNILISVQSLEFYYENAKKDSPHYKLVEDWLRNK